MGLYDPVLRLYYLFFAAASVGVVVNLQTEEVGYTEYDNPPTAGIALSVGRQNDFTGNEGTLLCTNTRVSSTNSLISTDSGLGSGSVVTSAWRSEPIATDLAGDWKQILDVNIDYRATSRSTLTLKIAADGNTFESTGRAVSLASAPVVGRVQSQVYAGGFAPTLELTSTATGYELHRLDVTMNIGGRRA